MEFPMRINKYLAHQGIASRREADVLVEADTIDQLHREEPVLAVERQLVQGHEVGMTDV